MPRSVPALIKPALLIWARNRSGLSLEQAAVKLKLDPGVLRAWEDGSERPSIAQLRDVGHAYKRPLAVFFLPEPPRDFDPQKEFRRLPGVSASSESPEMRNALRLALFRREAALELYERLGEQPLPLRIAAQPMEDAETVGLRIRQALGVSWQAQTAWASPHAALNAWRTAIERQGVLVFQNGEMSVKEMRGISIPRGPLPVILLNTADSPHGRIFTLLHEFGHILLANGGFETSTLEGHRRPEDRLLELAANRFAAAALMPRNEFLSEIQHIRGALDGNDEALRRFAARIKASPEAILRRLVSLGQASKAIYRAKRLGWLEKSWYKPPQGQGGPPLEVRIVSSAGRPFVSLVLDGYRRNLVSSSDVSDFLHIQLKFLYKVAEQLAQGPGQLEAVV